MQTSFLCVDDKIKGEDDPCVIPAKKSLYQIGNGCDTRKEKKKEIISYSERRF